MRQLAGIKGRFYRSDMRRIFLLFIAGLTLAACHAKEGGQPAQNETAAASTTGQGSKGVHRENEGRHGPAVSFSGPDQKPVKLGDFEGRPILVNFWASWCGPCIKELPTLDQLAKSGKIEVLAISQDSGPHASVVAFLQAHRIGTLKSYQDPNMGLAGALGAEVLPTSILFDSKGKEVWRYVGDFDWTSSQATKLLAEAGAAPPRA